MRMWFGSLLVLTHNGDGELAGSAPEAQNCTRAGGATTQSLKPTGSPPLPRAADQPVLHVEQPRCGVAVDREQDITTLDRWNEARRDHDLALHEISNKWQMAALSFTGTS